MSIKHFHHFGLTVPDVPVQQKFYEDFGLISEETENQIIMHCIGRDQDQIILTEGLERKLHHVSYGADEEGLAAVKNNIQTKQIHQTEWTDARPFIQHPGSIDIIVRSQTVNDQQLRRC